MNKSNSDTYYEIEEQFYSYEAVMCTVERRTVIARFYFERFPDKNPEGVTKEEARKSVERFIKNFTSRRMKNNAVSSCSV